MRSALYLAVLAAGLTFAGILRADEVVLNNGDKLNGKVGSIADGKMKFSSPVLGDITIEMKNVQTYTTDEPADLRLKRGGDVKGRVTAATTQEVMTEGNQPVPTADIKQINPPAEKWTGSIVASGLLTEGNSHVLTLAVSGDAALRRDNTRDDDRFSIKAGYNLSRQRDTSTGITSTTDDNWFGQFKYDRYFTEKWYAYGLFRVDHDNIANLNYRLSPGVGVGYQWIESPAFNFSTEAGASFVYEDYSDDGQKEHLALRLAYHVDKKLTDSLSFVHNLEWLPNVSDPSDYNLNTDAGLREQLTKSFFTEFKVQLQRDSTPAPGSLKNDLRFLLGLGWTF